MDSTCPFSQNPPRHRAYVAGVVALVMLLPTLCLADGEHVAQKAGSGDIVVTRNVATRPADRNPTSPGMALMVNASPNPQLGNALNGSGNSDEMSDTEIAGLTAGVVSRNINSAQGSMQRSLNAALGVNTGGNSAGAASNGVSSLVSGAVGGGGGAIADSTRGIGDQITNAVSQIPVPGGH
jgi:hypothetical protein